MSANIKIKFCVPVGHLPGDYAKLFGNGGSGEIDWDTPVNNEIYDLFPNGGGIYGFGQQPFGQTPFGRPWATRVAGFGQLPFGLHPFGFGTAVIEAVVRAEACGLYAFGFKVFDSIGNSQQGPQYVATIEVHTAPAAPSGLKKVSYDPDTDILVLEAA